MAEQAVAEPAKKVQVFHYETPFKLLSLQLEDSKIVEFIGGTFTTDNEDTAKKIELTKQFKIGDIFKSDAVKVAARRKTGVKSGASGTRKRR